MKLTPNQVRVLRLVEKRDHPGGEPRMDWLDKRSAAKLIAAGLVAPVPGTATAWRAEIAVLTDAGRAALAETAERWEDRTLNAYTEGRDARIAGRARGENPYPEAAPMRRLWDEGWRESDGILRDLGLADRPADDR